MPDNTALWYVADGRAELRAAGTPVLQAGDVRVAARYSGLSRGTERLVLHGRVPASEFERMRCPQQAGDFPFPVKYGYAMVGVIEDGPKERVGETVFLLHPHQRAMAVAAEWAHVVPKDVPAKRACLTANMETALNVTWDARVGPGDRVLIVGGGVLGLLIAGIVARIPGTTVTVADVDAARAPVAKSLDAAFALPKDAPGDQDVVIHTSSTADGLRLALAAAGPEARVVEASWYGDKDVAVPLGGCFHSGRLQLISSQVGAVPADRRARWTFARRIGAALDLLRDARFDVLITDEIDFKDAPVRVPQVLDSSSGLMTVLRYT